MVDLVLVSDADSAEDSARPYHHGDLRRALVDAARRILEAGADQATLSLRGVAREAGVSPAAPYHHFKDKSELLLAVAHEGFHGLTLAMKAARDADPDDALTVMGVAYVEYARANPGLYRVMYDCSRDKDELPEMDSHDDGPSAYTLVRDALIEGGEISADDELGLELATGALWCAVHGLAEMSSFTHFQPLIAACGGEREFYRATLAHVGHLKKAR